ncbi:MAG: hypothetical protein PHR96_00400 [Clostridia bacterium]|nr:hypothetical protein [Clostridia bacterium]
MRFFKKIVYVVCFILTAFALNVNGINYFVYAYTNNNTVSFEEVTLTNGEFDNNSNSTSLEKNPSGWSIIKQSSSATSGIINVDEKANKFSANYSTYQLASTENPKTISSDCDDHVLMINSRNSNFVETDTSQGYVSSNISLESYSYYEISVLVNTMNNAYASIYLTGFEDFDDEIQNYAVTNPDKFNYIKTNNRNWAEYTFYVQTNFNDISATLELYLGPTSDYTSTGVVFYDNISILKVTESKYISDLDNETNNYNVVKMDINYISEYFSSDYNFDFETSKTMNSWVIDGSYDASTTVARVLKVSSAEIMQSYNIVSLGTDNTSENDYALVLSSTEEANIGFSSKDIQIEQYGIYKISLNVKCNNIVGNAYIKIIENDDVSLIYGENLGYYTPSSSYITISSNSTNALKNDYTNVSFYVSGHTRYDTSIKLELRLGDEEDLSSGTVVFDNITVEKLSYEQLESISTDDNNKTLAFTTVSTSPTVENGNFNDVINQDANLTYPLQPDKWEQTTAGNENSVAWGVVNTKSTKWDTNDINLTNPRNPIIRVGTTSVTTPITDTNNILMIYNKGTTYQTITSPEISVSKDSYYTLSFDYMALKFNPTGNSILNIYIINENDKVVFEDLNVVSSSWANYKITIKTEQFASTLKLVLEVGSEAKPAQGVVYLDNVSFATESYSSEQYSTIVQANNSKILDLSNIGFYIKSSDKNIYGIYDALLFDSNTDAQANSSEPATGGIIDEENYFNINFPEHNISEVKNMLAISTYGEATYSLTSKYDLSLSANSYYKFTIYIKTQFASAIEDEEEHNYGAEFSINGLLGASIKNIKSDEFSQYTIYVFVDTAYTIQVQFALTSDDYNTSGNAFFDTFAYETIDKTQYTEATDSDTVLLFSTTDIEEESQDVEETDDEDVTTSSAQFWIALSTIIMTLTVILAVVLSYLRRIELKKYQVKKPTKISYDRATTVSPEIVIREAKNRKDSEIKMINQEIKELEEYLANLEEENKQRISRHRAEGITRKSEHEFKTYASSRRKFLKDIDKLNEKIKEVNSPEWLMQQEKQITNERAKLKIVDKTGAESTEPTKKQDNEIKD